MSELLPCKYCNRPRANDGSILHTGSCAGLASIILNQLQYDAMTARAAGAEEKLEKARDDRSWFEARLHESEQNELAVIRQLAASERRCAELREALQNSTYAVQAFLDMVNVIQRFQILPIPAILETAQHNCPIILESAKAALAASEVKS